VSDTVSQARSSGTRAIPSGRGGTPLRAEVCPSHLVASLAESPPGTGGTSPLKLESSQIQIDALRPRRGSRRHLVGDAATGRPREPVFGNVTREEVRSSA